MMHDSVELGRKYPDAVFVNKQEIDRIIVQIIT